MPCASSAESVLPGLKPYQPNQRIRPPTAPRMMLCGSIGPPPSRLKTRPRRGPSAIAPASEMAPPMRVHDGRAGEVVERRAHRGQPAVRTPGPVADDRVDEAGDADAVEHVADEAAAADHRARGDRRAGIGERELEDPEREQRNAGRAGRCRAGPSGRSRCVPMKPLPSSNMKAKPHAQNVTPQMQVSTMPSTRMLIDSRDRAKPASSMTKPTCMPKTRNAATSVHTVLIALISGVGAAPPASARERRREIDAHRREQEGEADGLAAHQREHVRAHLWIPEVGLQSLPERVDAHDRFLLLCLSELRVRAATRVARSRVGGATTRPSAAVRERAS